MAEKKSLDTKSMRNLPNCPFTLYVATPCRETIASWVERQETARSVADIAGHFQQSIPDTIEEILQYEPGTFGYVFRSYGDYPGVGALEPGTLVFLYENQIPDWYAKTSIKYDEQ